VNSYYFRGYVGSNVGRKIKGSYQFFNGTKIKFISAFKWVSRDIIVSKISIFRFKYTQTDGVVFNLLVLTFDI
jgi:hypothetical protein